MFYGESSTFRDLVPYVKLHRRNQKDRIPNVNVYGDNGERVLQNESCYTFIDLQLLLTVGGICSSSNVNTST